MSDGDVSEQAREIVQQNGHEAAKEWFKERVKKAPVVGGRIMAHDDLGKTPPKLDLHSKNGEEPVERKVFIEVLTPSQIKSYTPPDGIVLVGDTT
jgi:hypothetical protein